MQIIGGKILGDADSDSCDSFFTIVFWVAGDDVAEMDGKVQKVLWVVQGNHVKYITGNKQKMKVYIIIEIYIYFYYNV